jgi:hypothetical protein
MKNKSTFKNSRFNIFYQLFQHLKSIDSTFIKMWINIFFQNRLLYLLLRRRRRGRSCGEPGRQCCGGARPCKNSGAKQGRRGGGCAQQGHAGAAR